MLVEKAEPLEDADILVFGSARVRFNILDKVDLYELAMQQAQQRTAAKVERGAPMKTIKMQAFTGEDQ